MNKTYTLICALLGIEAFALNDNKATLTDEQLTSIEDALKAKDDTIAARTTEVADRDKIINDLRDQITELKKQPGDTTTNVVDNSKHNGTPETEKTDAEKYCDTVNSARKLYDVV